MTREEAIKVIRKMLAYTDLSDRTNLTADMVNACHLAIKALEHPERNVVAVVPCGDCISRADVNQVIEDYMDEQYHVLSDRTRERAFGANAVMARINELPSVTPQLSSELENASPIIDWNNCHTSEQLDSIATTKNDLAVDCISRKEVDRIINKWLSHPDYELKDHIYSMTEKIHNLPSATPQEPIHGK